MDKILVILTGGTIGSKSENGTVDVNSAEAYSIVNLYYEKYGRDFEFEAIQPVNVLSENITAEIWIKLCRCLDNIDFSIYKGVVICHGSDTLSYTSALIGMLYNKISVPLVIIASDYELANEKSNGLVNFRSALMVIKNMERGIFTAYSNNKGENDVYISTRIVESDPYTDQFRSFDGIVWGQIISDRLVVKSDIGIDEINEYKGKEVRIPENFNKKVMLIRPYPDMRYDNINLDGISAVVHYSYHSATACVAGEETSVLKFANRCRKLGVKLYMASYKDKRIERAYESSREILSEGVVPMFNISAEAAYVKVLIAENTDNVDVSGNLYFESVERE